MLRDVERLENKTEKGKKIYNKEGRVATNWGGKDKDKKGRNWMETQDRDR